MHKGSLPRAVAVDALCIIAGFVAGIATIDLLPSSLDPTAALQSSFYALQASFHGSGPVIDRARKGDRLDLLPLADRFTGIGFAPPKQIERVPHRDLSGRTMFWIDPAANTMIVPKGLISESAGSEAVKPRPAPKSRDRGEEPPPKIGCEPLASPIVDPVLARLAGRCLAQLGFPTVD